MGERCQELEEFAREIAALKSSLKDFEETHAEIFESRRDLTNQINAKRDEMLEFMKQINKPRYESQDGIIYQTYRKRKLAHSLDQLKAIVCDDEKVSSYVDSIADEQTKMRIKKPKKTKREDD